MPIKFGDRDREIGYDPDSGSLREDVAKKRARLGLEQRRNHATERRRKARDDQLPVPHPSS